MNESQYSADSKGDYKGSLCTRLRSLTNGINGMIFSADELDSADLFDRNVIVDLSRVGSTETKALIMGLLVMKLQEYRMSQGGMNETLRHVTVLEEAHNLLKRTSTVQGAVGADLAGKSVEMLANAIAEMRTYGEGFIIADQAPGLLDEAVIRNTNTKIILRLPDYTDRQLVGRAIGLNDDQIDELSKLKQGVAAVYQNDWVEAVLCQVDHFEPEPAEDFSKNCGKSLPSFTELPPYDAHSLLIELASGRLYVEPSDRRVLNAELPVKVKCLMFEYSETSIFFDDGYRTLSVAEILEAEHDLHVDFISQHMIPVIDCGENDFVVYLFCDKVWSKFNIVDECFFKRRTSMRDLM